MYIILNDLVIQIGIVITLLIVLGEKTLAIHPFHCFSLLAVVTSAMP